MRPRTASARVRLSGAVLLTVLALGAIAAVSAWSATSEPEQLGFWAGDVDPTWAWTVDGMTTSLDAAHDVAASGLRTIYVAGSIGGVGGSQDMSLAKYVDGGRVWAKTYDGPYHGTDTAVAVAVRGTAIYTVGTREHSSTDYGDIVLIRWNRDGKRVWTRVYDSGARETDFGKDVAVDGDGNVTLVGSSYSTRGQFDWVVISYTASGTRRYVRRYDGPSHLSDQPVEMHLDSAGRVYVVGSSTSAVNKLDVLLAKYSATGTRLWARRFNGSGNDDDEPFSLRARPGGGVYIAGITTGATTGEDGLLLSYTSAGVRDFAVVETGSEWTSSLQQAFFDVELMPGGDILCGGSDERPATGRDRFLVRYSPAGIPVDRSWETSPGDLDEWVTHLVKDRQGGVYVTGLWATSLSTGQVYTQRIRDGGTSWVSWWPMYPTEHDVPYAVAVNGVNVYVVGRHHEPSTGYDQLVMAYVY